MDKRESAKKLLRHYFRMVWQKAGLTWDADNDAEINDLADLLMGDEPLKRLTWLDEALNTGDGSYRP